MKEIGKNILVIRFGALGDSAKCAHLVAALSRDYPSAHITVLTKTRYVPVFNRIARLSFITYAPEGRNKGVAGFLRLRREVAHYGFDCIVDLQNSPVTMLLRSMVPARSVAILPIRSQRKLLTRKFRKVMMQLPPFVDRCSETFARAGFNLNVTPSVGREPLPVTRRVEERYGVKCGNWIGISTFGKHRGQIYPIPQADRLIGLMTHFADRVFVFGHGRYEVQFAEAMEGRHIGAVSVADRLPLDVEEELIGSLDVMVTTDSSLMHLASWLGTPVVSVWGATHPLAGHYGFGQSLDNAVQTDLRCRPCSKSGNRNCLWGDYRCMTRLEPSSVAERVEQIVRHFDPPQPPPQAAKPNIGFWQKVRQGTLW